jgi:protein-disulfide isomerase
MAIWFGDNEVHGRRNAVGAAVALLALALFALFAWRVYHYASRIQSGELTEEDLAFTRRYSASEAVALAPVPEGEFVVDTADDPALGADAPVLTVVEFADFGCPYSKEAAFAVRNLAAAFGDRVRFVYRDFPIGELHPEAFVAAEAAECAAEQGRFWEYHDKLYANQSDHSEDALTRYAAELNLNAGEFRRCLSGHRNAAEVEEDYAAGASAGVRGTPTFFFNGVRIPGAIPEETFARLIDRFVGRDSTPVTSL